MPTRQTVTAAPPVVDILRLPQPFSQQYGSYRDLKLTLEDKIVLALLELDWLCAQFPTKLRNRAWPAHTIARQWRPGVVDAVTGVRRAYRLDFAYPPTLVALEVDGYNRRGSAHGRGGHVTWTGFHADRERDRNLTLAGWRVLRCGPADLQTPAGAVLIAGQFIRLIQLVKKEAPDAA